MIRKPTAIIAATFLVLAVLGCRMEAESAADRTVDVVVVGSGIAGSMAALGAKEAGAARVLLIEKSSYFGGSSQRSSGAFAVEVLNARNNPEGSLAQWKIFMGNSTEDTGFPDYDKWLEVAVHAGDRIDYLRSLGLNISGEVAGGGSALMAKLQETLEKQGVEILLNCRAVEVATHNGAAAGVNAVYKRGSFRIDAGNVILATGGFSKNPDLVAGWAGDNPGLSYVVSMSDDANDGQGILMAQQAGGALYPNTFAMLAGLQFSAKLASISAFARPSFFGKAPAPLESQILVNSEGKRFMNEAAGASDDVSVLNFKAAYLMVKDSKPPYCIIYDSSDNWVGFTNITAALEAAFALNTGEVVKAPSIPELAAEMNVPAQELNDTVTGYNAYAVSRVDGEHEKAGSLLKQIATPPYYAVKLYPNSYGSMGGVVTDSLGRVLDADKTAVPHLFAAGEISNRDFFNQTYVGGASLALYSTVGWLAGKTAAGR